MPSHHPTIKTPHLDPKNPIGAPFILNRFHPNRLTTRGLQFAARIYAISLLRQTFPKQSKIMMIGRARSGTTLLSRLLTQLPDLRFDGEMLANYVPFPHQFADRLASTAKTPHYGFKLLSFQIAEVYRAENGPAFLQKFADRGWKFVHVRRNTLPQIQSLLTAQSVGSYHAKTGEKKKNIAAPPIDEYRFLRALDFQTALLKFEEDILAEFDHVKVSYEADLLDASAHQATIDRLCAAFGLQHTTVEATLQKLSSKTFHQTIPNADALEAMAREAGYGHVFDEYAQSLA